MSGAKLPESTSTHDELPRQLGVFDTAALYVGIILGSGIFVAPAVVAKVAPGTSGIFLWLGAGLVAAIGAFVYAECGARLPHPGGFYVFYRDALGRPVAFIGGWAALAVTYPASGAAIAHVLAQYLADLVPAAAGHETLVAVLMCVVAGVLGAAGVRSGAWTQRVLTALKVVGLALLCAAAFTAPAHVEVAPAAGAPGALGLDFAAVVGAWMVLMWTYDGWSNISLIAGEVRHPNKLLPAAVALGTAALVALYCVVQLAVAHTLGSDAASSEHVLSDAVKVGFGAGASGWVSATIVVSTFGSLAGQTFAGARIGFAMAKDELLPSALGRLDPRLKTPAASIALLTLATIIYAAFGGFDKLLALFSFSVWVFYGLCAVCLLILRARHVGGPGVFRAPGGPLAPLILLIFAGAMAVGVVVDDPWDALAGIGALACGVPVYLVWHRFTRRAPLSSAGPPGP